MVNILQFCQILILIGRMLGWRLKTAHRNVSLWESEGFTLFSTNSPSFQGCWNPLLSDEANSPFMMDENGTKSLDEQVLLFIFMYVYYYYNLAMVFPKSVYIAPGIYLHNCICFLGIQIVYLSWFHFQITYTNSYFLMKYLPILILKILICVSSLTIH